MEQQRETERQKQYFSTGWKLCRGVPIGDDTRWIHVKTVPSVVHVDLMALPDGHPDKIGDPFVDLNELDAQWVADEKWTYQLEFPTPPILAEKRAREPRYKIDLVFEGLDTVAVVRLNNQIILEANNMFLKFRIDVRSFLNYDAEPNILSICFEPARLVGLDRLKNMRMLFGAAPVADGAPLHNDSKMEYYVHQTEEGRAAVRKAQYHWGWDWGPILTTAGPWKPIFLDAYDGYIMSMKCVAKVNPDFVSGVLQVAVEVSSMDASLATFSLRHPDGSTVIKTLTLGLGRAPRGVHRFKHSFDVPQVRLWWPRNYGEQPMYTVNVKITDMSMVLLDSDSVRVGFRTVELVQTADQLGRSFYFKINNVDVFMGGSCWVPAHSFLPAIDPQAGYQRWLELAADGNQTMIRVWGGGIYESDAFYDACDSLGLLVWQDFAFACAVYPANDAEFRNMVLREARQNVERLCCHPSLVVWAGNNEDYQMVDRYQLQYDTDPPQDPRAWLGTNFPARILYEHHLPKIVAEAYGGGEGHCVAYHPGSPFGDGKSMTLAVDPTIGDVHQWNVWHGIMMPYQKLPEFGGRFVSEFGMEAYPHVASLQRCITQAGDQLRPGSLTMDVRNKAVGHSMRLMKYVTENFRVGRLDDLASFTHLTQIMQADTMDYAYRRWRRNWDVVDIRQCGGVLVWQLNDCWPTISWAVVDFFQVPKPAYYAIKRAMEPLTVNACRVVHDWTTRPVGNGWQRETGHVQPVLSSAAIYDVWISNLQRKPLSGCQVKVRFISVASGADVLTPLNFKVSVKANGSTYVVTKGESPEGLESTSTSTSAGSRLQALDHFVIWTTLQKGSERLSSDASWPDPIKYLDLSNRGVAVDYDLPADQLYGTMTATAARPTKGLVFAEEPGGHRLSDNGIDIMPGEKHTVTVTRASLDEEWKQMPFTYVGADQDS